MQSATSLFATLTFSHALSPDQFGVLTVYWVVWTLILALNRAVFGEQLLASSTTSNESQGYSAFMMCWLGTLVIITFGIVVATSAIDLLPGIVYIILFVSVDAVRYWALSQPSNDIRRAETLLACGESVRLAISALVLIFVLHDIGTAALLWLVALSSLSIAAAFPAAFHASISAAVGFLRSRKQFEGIMLFQFLALNGTGQLIPLMIVPTLGPAAYGTLNLSLRLIAPVTILGSAFQPALIRYFAGNDGPDTPKRLIKAGTVVSSTALVTVVACYVAIQHLGHLVISPEQLYGVHSLLGACLVGVGAIAVGQPGGALIRVRRLGRVSLVGHFAGVLATVIGVIVAVETGDVVVVAWALAFGTCVTVVVSYALLLDHLLRHRTGR